MGAPSIKVRKVEIFWNKISLTGFKWSSLNAPSTETPVYHPFFGQSPFLIYIICGNKKWEPQYRDEEAPKLEKLWNKISLTGCISSCCRGRRQRGRTCRSVRARLSIEDNFKKQRWCCETAHANIQCKFVSLLWGMWYILRGCGQQ